MIHSALLSFILLASFAGLSSLCTPDSASAQPLDDPHATTELTCSFGMAKGESSRSCTVPFPAGCVVAYIPSTTKPWASVSKGGKTTCRFHEMETDWKTRITGICGRCTTAQCSAQFHVRFNCSDR
jgi:hypothetical protein